MNTSSFERWVAAGALGFVTLVAVLGPERLHVLPGCLFHEWTGLLCAGCGSTRALASLTHGDWMAALHFNPLSVTFLLALPGLLLLRRTGYRPPPLLIWSVAGVLLSFWVLRNIPLPLFDLLRP